MLISVVTVTCTIGLASGTTGTHAAGWWGVGPSPTGATGTARACEATAANHGLSYANGLKCVAGTASLTITYDPSITSPIITGSGLIPGSEVWIYDSTVGEYYDAGSVDANGNFNFSAPGCPLGYSDTWTPEAFAAGVNPNVDTSATPYLTGNTLTLNC